MLNPRAYGLTRCTADALHAQGRTEYASGWRCHHCDKKYDGIFSNTPFFRSSFGDTMVICATCVEDVQRTDAEEKQKLAAQTAEGVK